jgi:hypothetical protein
MDQATEIQIMLQGVTVEALQLDNHAQHIQELDRFSQGKAFEQLEQWQVAMLAQHKKQHQQMLVAQQQAGAVTASNAGQANNVPAIPTDLGGLEGGVQ